MMRGGPTPDAPPAKAVFLDGALLGSIVERDRAFVALGPSAQEIGAFSSEREAAE